MSDQLEIAEGVIYSMPEAMSTIAGYAFSTRTREIKNMTSDYGVDADGSIIVPNYGYVTYDCAVAAPGPELSEADLLVSVALNGPLDIDSVAMLQFAASRAYPLLRQLDPGRTFWDLPVESIDDGGDNSLVDGDPDALIIHRLWSIFMQTPEIGPAITHKVLHHKLPRLFPLFDNQTLPSVGNNRAWRTVREKLETHESAFEELERWFAALAADRQKSKPSHFPSYVSLSRLRLYDILLWCNATGKRTAASESGNKILGG